ncbi:MAG TPA: MBL fold metallo-hydrolase [Solirubrobacteraceae bacterium]|nr:MBL fold metallo-hydrolase [Solirubrobacteraceae bacterium]
MRARALHADAIVITSSLLQVNCVLLRGGAARPGQAPEGPLSVVEVPAGGAPTPQGAETFVVDSPVLPEELELLPSVLAQAGFPEPAALLATHADWDHVLGPLAFPGTPLGCAESSAARLRAEPGEAQRELRSFDEELYLERPRPLGLGSVQALPVPGHLEIGEQSLELHATGGHTPDGMAILAPWAGVLIAGDYLSAVEIPMLNPGGEVDGYLATLERLRLLLSRVEHVVPGHGPILGPERAAEVLEEDVAYLRALAGEGADAPLPEGRRSAEMRKLHARNVSALAAP